ncbi:NADH:quinone oxidoreductase [Pseudomonas sp. SWRI153]|uniref:NADH:quinone oxidoreductase n=1 Tax=Pseudomonas khorasanensis TaxID=2745508 RepID=A0A923JEQ3_9PSED|nr:Rnf-Nqr domain containing protein [Pseudomonas khorasanensis]MBV4485343.1 NADH:quinone oxidoreductase [Pseudomonas khorasanensis]
MKRPATLTHSLMLVPLLGTTATLSAALGMILMLGVVTGAFAVCMAPLRKRLKGASTLLTCLLLAATLTSCADTLAQRWFLPWHQASAIYTGLIALQCIVLEYTGFFSRPAASRVKDCVVYGGLMVSLGGLREIFGHGTLGRGLSAHWQGLVIFPEGLHLLTLVPGAFVLLGLLLAARQAWTRRNSVIKETHHS